MVANNTENGNTENGNTGDYNTGYRNTGDRNAGDYNAGDYNTGYRNIGEYNTGNYNAGDYNTGYRNTGDYNTGNYNTGHRNTGHRNSGYLNTKVNQGYLFNKPCDLWDDAGNILVKFPDRFYFDYRPIKIEWIEDESYDMGGYLKTTEKETDIKYRRKKSLESADSDDVMKTFDLPNWDNEVFKEITGIDLEEWRQNKDLEVKRQEGNFMLVVIYEDGTTRKFGSNEELKEYANSL